MGADLVGAEAHGVGLVGEPGPGVVDLQRGGLGGEAVAALAGYDGSGGGVGEGSDLAVCPAGGGGNAFATLPAVAGEDGFETVDVPDRDGGGFWPRPAVEQV